VNFLTRCAAIPQVEITRGGTFIRFSFASATATRARVQLGLTPPQLNSQGFPQFNNPIDVVASAISNKPALVHDVTLVDELLEPDITGHAALRSGQTLFYVILAWNAAGDWDAIWNSTAALSSTGTPLPEAITTKQRSVTVALRKLTCLDDSDDLSAGEASFTFRVRGGTVDQTKTVTWDPMDSGSISPSYSNSTKVTINPPDASGGVDIRLEGTEDDSDSVPPDSDDKASPQGLSGFTPLKFPVGEGKEEATDQVLVWTSQQLTFSEVLSFESEIVYNVSYV
jgi:hypothetical protein